MGQQPAGAEWWGSQWEQLPYSRELSVVLFAVVPIWALGLSIGLLLPRPKWLDPGAFLSQPASLLLRRLTLLYHLAYILRAIWSHCAGALRTDQAAMASHGAAVSRDHKHHRRRRRGAPEDSAAQETPAPQEDERLSRWYVQEEDLEFFKDRVERDTPMPGCGAWELVMSKDFGSGVTYSAWKRHLADGKTDYKSVTIAEDATAQEFMDFYLDDDARARWDAMISHHELLENGPPGARCQVVRWVRSFPFSFIKEREYIIARRAWAQQGCLYGITKAIQHPRAAYGNNIIRMDKFYSMWRSRTVPCPKGTDRPACETVLLHREDFKIPEKMARFAVRHGMAGFVKKMGGGVKPFVEARRARVDRFEEDKDAYGMSLPQNPPGEGLERTTSGQSVASTVSAVSDLEGGAFSDVASQCSVAGTRSSWQTPLPQNRKPRLRQFGCALVATWAAIVIKNAV